MKDLALELPGGAKITPIVQVGPGRPITEVSLGAIVSGALDIIILLSGVLLLIWLIIAAFQWITSSGDKERLAQARARITYAIIGFILIIIAFSVKDYIQKVLNPQSVQIRSVSDPGVSGPGSGGGGSGGSW